MALLNFGKKKEAKAPACACCCGCATGEATLVSKIKLGCLEQCVVDVVISLSLFHF